MTSTDRTEAKPTYEQLEFMVGDRDRQLEKTREALRAKEEDVRRLRLILRGMVSEHFHLNVTLSPEIFTKNSFDAVQAILNNYAGRTVGEIDAKLGGPLRLLQEALMHIHYIENHARANNVSFTPFERRAGDAWLYY